MEKLFGIVLTNTLMIGTHPTVITLITSLYTGMFISLFMHEYGHMKTACRCGIPPIRMSLGWAFFGFGWCGNRSGWGFGRGSKPEVDPDPRLYDDVQAVRKMAMAGPLGSGLALILVLILAAITGAAINIRELSLPWIAPNDWITGEPALNGLFLGLAGGVVANVLSIIYNLIPSGKTADRLSDGMFIFQTEQAIAMKKQALLDKANQRREQ